MSVSITNYEKILPTGKKNAISTDELIVLLGFTDARGLQMDIAKASKSTLIRAKRRQF